MSKFKPAVLLDEQMYLSGDTQNTLLFQIREELKDLNGNIKQLSKDLNREGSVVEIPETVKNKEPKQEEQEKETESKLKKK